MAAINLTGSRFGRLVVLRKTDKRSSSFIVWECLCDCGNTKLISGSSLRSGTTKSCGCLRREITIKRFTTHKLGGTPTHKSWSHMLYRCTNRSAKKWVRYGGRGIKVCERWYKFENFLADMGEKPPGTSIDRINNEGHYEPGNCRWATQKDQQNNRSTNRLLTTNGLTMNLKQWADHLKIDYTTLQRRLAKGWATEKVLSPQRFRRSSRKLAPDNC